MAIPWSTYFGSDTYQLYIADGDEVELTGDAEITSPQGSSTPALWVHEGGKLITNPLESASIYTRGNIRIQGELEMVTDLHTVDHRIQFLPKTDTLPGVDELLYTGGQGMTMVDRPGDIGLWVDHAGLAKIHGPYIRPWARVTGSLSAGQTVLTMKCDVEAQGWKAGHRLVIGPMREITEAERTAGKWFHHLAYSEVEIVSVSGASVTVTPGLQNDHPLYLQSVTGNVYTAEVLNMNRQVTIGGTAGARAHVHFHTHRADHELRNYRTEYMGPRQPISNKTHEVQGAYGLHFHHAYDRSRGLVLFGIVMEHIGNHCFVTHESHGITVRGCVTHNTYEAPYWWDKASGHVGADVELYDSTSNDIFWDRNIASNYRIPSGSVTGFELRAGEGSHMQGNVSFGQHDAKRGSGQSWPSLGGSAASGVWVPFHNNIQHNCYDHGVFTWSNISDPRHVVELISAFRNGRSALMNGAYGNRFTYFDGIYEDNSHCVDHFSGSPVPSSEDVATAHRAGHYRNYWNSSGRPRCFVSQHQRLGGTNWVEIHCNKLVNYSEVGFTIADAQTTSNKNTPRLFTIEKCVFDGLAGSEPFLWGDEPLDGSIVRVDKSVCTTGTIPFDETDAFELYPVNTASVPTGAVWVPEWNCWKLDVASFSTTTMEFDDPDRLYPQVLELDDTPDLNAGLITPLANTVSDRFSGTSLHGRWVPFGTTAVNEKLTVTLAASVARTDSGVYTPKEYDLRDVRSFVEVGAASAAVDQYYELRLTDGEEAVRWRLKAGVLTAEIELDGITTAVGTISTDVPTVWGFRGSEDGISVFFETSSDFGQTWDILGSTTSITAITLLQHYLGAYAEDSAGGTAEFLGLNVVASAAYVPTVALWLNETIPSGNWFRTSVTFNVSANDPAATLEYAIDEGARVAYTEPVTLSADGVYLIEAWATNAEGVSEVQQVLVQIDTTPPVTTASSSDVGGLLLLTLAAIDGEENGVSGEGDTFYRLSGAASWIEYDGPIPVPWDGSTYEFYSDDLVGNEEEVQTWTAPDLYEYRVWTSTGETEALEGDRTLLMDWGSLEELRFLRSSWIAPPTYLWVYVQARDTLDNAESAVVSQRFIADVWEFRGQYSIGAAAVDEAERLDWFDWSPQADRAELPPAAGEGDHLWLYLQARDGSTLVEGPVSTHSYVVDGGAAVQAGVATLTYLAHARVRASATDAIEGTAPYSYQWERSATGGGLGFSDLTGQSSLLLDDQTVVPETTYFYRLRYTDAGGGEAHSNELEATTPAAPVVGEESGGRRAGRNRGRIAAVL